MDSAWCFTESNIAMIRCAKALAWLKGRDYVTPSDLHSDAATHLKASHDPFN